MTRGFAVAAAWLATVQPGIGAADIAMATPAQATFNPAAAGLPGASFTAEALTGSGVSRISNGAAQADGSFTWNETGYRWRSPQRRDRGATGARPGLAHGPPGAVRCSPGAAASSVWTG